MFVKICGITNENDALLSVALGADAIGFIFAPSKRQVSKDQVKDIVKQLPSEIMTFGVFVNENPDSVVRTVHEIGLSGAQLHGSEGPEAVDYISSRMQVVLKAFSGNLPTVERMAKFNANAFLIDSPNPGSGIAFDWTECVGLSAKVRLILAGGLTPENVEDAIRIVRPFGVDVSSGVEARPGKKDPAKLRLFIAKSRAALLEIPGRDSEIDSSVNPFVQDLISKRSAMIEKSGDGVFDWEEEL